MTRPSTSSSTGRVPLQGGWGQALGDQSLCPACRLSLLALQSCHVPKSVTAPGLPEQSATSWGLEQQGTPSPRLEVQPVRVPGPRSLCPLWGPLLPLPEQPASPVCRRRAQGSAPAAPSPAPWPRLDYTSPSFLVGTPALELRAPHESGLGRSPPTLHRPHPPNKAALRTPASPVGDAGRPAAHPPSPDTAGETSAFASEKSSDR